MNFSKSGNYYFWQIPTNFGQVGQLKAFINYFNKQEKRKGEFYKNKFEELISSVINDGGKIPTKEANKEYFIDNENIEYLLNFDSEEETKEFVEAIQKFNLVKFSDSKKVFYLSDYSQFIGSNKKSKSSRKNKEDKDDSQTSPEYEALTDSQKRMYNQAKAKGYKGSVQDFISGKDSEEIDKLISNNKGITKSQIKEEVDNGKSFFDE